MCTWVAEQAFGDFGGFEEAHRLKKSDCLELQASSAGATQVKGLVFHSVRQNPNLIP